MGKSLFAVVAVLFTCSVAALAGTTPQSGSCTFPVMRIESGPEPLCHGDGSQPQALAPWQQPAPDGPTGGPAKYGDDHSIVSGPYAPGAG